MLVHSANGSRWLICVKKSREFREIVARTAGRTGIVYQFLVRRCIAEMAGRAGQRTQGAVARHALYL